MAENRDGIGRVSHLKMVIRLVIAILVVVWVGKTIAGSRKEIIEQGLVLTDFSAIALLSSAACYVGGLMCFGVFWHQGLVAMGQRPRWTESLSSYFVSQLGKYVPGKALVVVIRSDRIASERVTRSVAVIGVFVETLGMMAVGGIMSSLFVSIRYIRTGIGSDLVMLAVPLGICAVIAASPPVFRLVLMALSRRRGMDSLSDAIAGLTWSVVLRGWIISCGGWVLLGMSLVFVLESFPESSTRMIAYSNYPQILSAVALAMVAGFASLLPGGAGVREMVIVSLLFPVVGVATALLSAVVLRVVWLLCELLVSGVCYGWYLGTDNAENGKT